MEIKLTMTIFFDYSTMSKIVAKVFSSHLKGNRILIPNTPSLPVGIRVRRLTPYLLLNDMRIQSCFFDHIITTAAILGLPGA